MVTSIPLDEKQILVYCCVRAEHFAADPKAAAMLVLGPRGDPHTAMRQAGITCSTFRGHLTN